MASATSNLCSYCIDEAEEDNKYVRANNKKCSRRNCNGKCGNWHPNNIICSNLLRDGKCTREGCHFNHELPKCKSCKKQASKPSAPVPPAAPASASALSVGAMPSAPVPPAAPASASALSVDAVPYVPQNIAKQMQEMQDYISLLTQLLIKKGMTQETLNQELAALHQELTDEMDECPFASKDESVHSSEHSDDELESLNSEDEADVENCTQPPPGAWFEVSAAQHELPKRDD